MPDKNAASQRAEVPQTCPKCESTKRSVLRRPCDTEDGSAHPWHAGESVEVPAPQPDFEQIANGIILRALATPRLVHESLAEELKGLHQVWSEGTSECCQSKYGRYCGGECTCKICAPDLHVREAASQPAPAPTCTVCGTGMKPGYVCPACGSTPAPVSQPASAATPQERCAAEKFKHGTPGGGDPIDCDFPFCGCFKMATKTVEALTEIGWGPAAASPAPPARTDSNVSFAETFLATAWHDDFEDQSADLVAKILQFAGDYEKWMDATKDVRPAAPPARDQRQEVVHEIAEWLRAQAPDHHRTCATDPEDIEDGTTHCGSLLESLAGEMEAKFGAALRQVPAPQPEEKRGN